LDSGTGRSGGNNDKLVLELGLLSNQGASNPVPPATRDLVTPPTTPDKTDALLFALDLLPLTDVYERIVLVGESGMENFALALREDIAELVEWLRE